MNPHVAVEDKPILTGEWLAVHQVANASGANYSTSSVPLSGSALPAEFGSVQIGAPSSVAARSIPASAA